MRIRTRTFPVLLALVLSLAATMAAKPALAGDDGHFDRTLTVTGAVDLDVQTGSGEITVRTGDSSKVEIHGRIRANHGWVGGDPGQSTPANQSKSAHRAERQHNSRWPH